jgi:hypothetical protein
MEIADAYFYFFKIREVGQKKISFIFTMVVLQFPDKMTGRAQNAKTGYHRFRPTHPKW